MIKKKGIKMDFIKGMDLSTLDEVESLGGSFFDKGTKGDAMKILKNYGMNLLRLRLWNNPYDDNGQSFGAGTCDLPTIMRLAKRAKELDISWCLDFHYSDFWTDPGKQRVPRAWEGMDAAQMADAVYNFTRDTLKTLAEADLKPDMVAVGNEITNGLLWPLGQKPNWENIVSFLNSGIRAVRECDAKIPVMLHLDNGGNNEMYRDWFDHYFEFGGKDFEYMGLSYYPFWHGSLDDLRNNMNDMARRYHKDMIVAEVSTGFTLEDYQAYEKLSDDKRKGMATKKELADKVPYPMSPEGQKSFMEDIMKLIDNVEDARGKGFIYWEPAWIPVAGSEWASEAAISYMKEKGPGGNEWANQALFDYDGNALVALSAIRDF